MEMTQITGTTILFNDAYTGVEKYGRIVQVIGHDAVIRIISREEAGPSPRRVKLRSDTRIAATTDGTSLID